MSGQPGESYTGTSFVSNRPTARRDYQRSDGDASTADMTQRRKRHHYVPAFYLRRFADSQNQLQAYRRNDERHVARMPVRSAAVEAGLYMVEDSASEATDAAEIAISEIEAEIAPAFDALLAGPWPPKHEVRGLVANMVAFQAVRTREMLHTFEGMWDAMAKLGMSVLTRDQLRQLIIDAGDGEPSNKELDETMSGIQDFDGYRVEIHPNVMVETMMRTAVDFVQPVADRSWFLQVCSEPLIITSDTPVVAHSSGGAPAGLLNAEEIWFPIDPYHNLLMVLDDQGWPEAKVPMPPSLALQLSHGLALSSYEWVFANPNDGVLDMIELPMGARPLAYIAGKPLWRPGIEPESS